MNLVANFKIATRFFSLDVFCRTNPARFKILTIPVSLRYFTISVFSYGSSLSFDFKILFRLNSTVSRM
ncbi:MAG: hypothetical protein WCJ95_19425, partial [Mariniphaga sp.]